MPHSEKKYTACGFSAQRRAALPMLRSWHAYPEKRFGDDGRLFPILLETVHHVGLSEVLLVHQAVPVLILEVVVVQAILGVLTVVF